MTDINESATKMVRQYLEDQGITVIEQDYECKAGKIDLVCMEDSDLAFITIKVQNGLAMPDDKVTATFRSRMETVALNFLASHNLASCQVRFDTVRLAMIGDGKAMLRYHRDVLSAPNVRQSERSTDTGKAATKRKRTKAYER